MSDMSQGPGWWQASDDKWYPPEQQPNYRPPPPSPVPSSKKRKRWPWAVGIVVLVVIAVVVAAASQVDEKKTTPPPEAVVQTTRPPVTTSPRSTVPSTPTTTGASSVTVTPEVVYTESQAPTNPIDNTNNPYVGPFTITGGSWRVDWFVTDCSFGGETLSIGVYLLGESGNVYVDQRQIDTTAPQTHEPLGQGYFNEVGVPQGSSLLPGMATTEQYQLQVESPNCNWSVKIVQFVGTSS